MTIVFLLVIGGAKLLIFPGGSGPASDVPPVGTVWFGRSFDTGTFIIRNRVTMVGTTEAFVLVAHLPRSLDARHLAIRISWNGSVVGTTNINSTDTGDVWGVSGGPLFQAGTWKYEFTDIGGNVLASGKITATE